MIIYFTIFLLILINYIIFYVQKPLVKYKQKNEKIVKKMKILKKLFSQYIFLNNHLNTIIGGSLRLFYPKIEYEREDIKTDEDNVYISIDWVKRNDQFDKILILYPGLTGKFYY
jgi:hypothetical protein